MDVLLPVFQLLYFIAHFLVSLYQAVYDALFDLYRYLRRLGLQIFNPSQGLQQAKKVPLHPVLLLLPGQYRSTLLNQLAAVLADITSAGATCITAYDAEGKLLEDQLTLLCQMQKLLPGHNVMLLSDSGTTDDHKVLVQDSESKGKKQTVLLRVLSFESGCSEIVHTVRNIGHNYSIAPHSLTVEDLHQLLSTVRVNDIKVSNSCCDHLSLFNSHSDSSLTFSDKYRRALISDSAVLRSTCTSCRNCDRNSCMKYAVRANPVVKDADGNIRMPDPDLIIVVGKYLSSNGYPAWYLRLSEFCLTGRLGKLDSVEVNNVIQMYSKIEQRYGR